MAVACAGSSVPTSSAWRLSSGRNTWCTTSTCVSCKVPMRTLSPLRAASESDQFSARVRSSLPSRYWLPMCSSAAPSWYLPLSSSCSTKPTAVERAEDAVHGALREFELARELGHAESSVAAREQA